MGEEADPISSCPECSLETYVTSYDYEDNKCEWCEIELGQCTYCEDQLHPNDVSWDDYSVCSYCANKLAKLMNE